MSNILYSACGISKVRQPPFRDPGEVRLRAEARPRLVRLSGSARTHLSTNPDEGSIHQRTLIMAE